MLLWLSEREARVMGSIVSFVPRRAANRPAGKPSELLATIIIFPGVRYERHTDLDEASGGDERAKPDKPVPRH